MGGCQQNIHGRNEERMKRGVKGKKKKPRKGEKCHEGGKSTRQQQNATKWQAQHRCLTQTQLGNPGISRQM